MISTPTDITMTTVEIAAMTGKQHKNVLRDVDRAIANVTKAQVNQLKSEPVDLGASEATYLDAYKRDKRMLINFKTL